MDPVTLTAMLVAAAVVVITVILALAALFFSYARRRREALRNMDIIDEASRDNSSSYSRQQTQQPGYDANLLAQAAVVQQQGKTGNQPQQGTPGYALVQQ